MTVKELARIAKENLEENESRKRVRRVKKKQRKNSESCPLSLGEASLSAEPSPVKGRSRKLSTKELNKEKADRERNELCKFLEE